MQESLQTTNSQEHRNHLDFSIKGARPIMVCVGTLEDFRKSETSEQNIHNYFGLENVEQIHWDDDLEFLERKKFLNNGSYTYVISTVNNRNKLSEKFDPCTGLIVAGIDKETGENISFVTHQRPNSVFGSTDEPTLKFISDLDLRLAEIKGRCILRTIDAIVIGGKYKYADQNERANNRSKSYYLDLTKLLGREVNKIIGFQPTVVNGPKISNSEDSDDIYYDNRNRRLYFIRPKVNPNTKDVSANRIDEEAHKWE